MEFGGRRPWLGLGHAPAGGDEGRGLMEAVSFVEMAGDRVAFAHEQRDAIETIRADSLVDRNEPAATETSAPLTRIDSHLRDVRGTGADDRRHDGARQAARPVEP